MRDEPTHAQLALPDQRLVLVALLDVPLGDGHAAVRALRPLVELRGDVRDRGTAVLVSGGGAADEVVGVDTEGIDGLVEPSVEAAWVGLGDALVHDGFLAADVLEHRGEVGWVVELAERERARFRCAALLFLDVVDDEAVGGERGAALDELAGGLLQLILRGALERGRQACEDATDGGWGMSQRRRARSGRIATVRGSAMAMDNRSHDHHGPARGWGHSIGVFGALTEEEDGAGVIAERID